MAKRALLQPLGKAILFLVGDVLASLVQKLLGAVQTAGVVQPGVDRRMIVQVLAVVDGRSLDFRNRVIDGVNRFLLLVAQFAPIVCLQMGASGAKIRQRVQIGGMLALRERIA